MNFHLNWFTILCGQLWSHQIVMFLWHIRRSRQEISSGLSSPAFRRQSPIFTLQYLKMAVSRAEFSSFLPGVHSYQSLKPSTTARHLVHVFSWLFFWEETVAIDYLLIGTVKQTFSKHPDCSLLCFRSYVRNAGRDGTKNPLSRRSLIKTRVWTKFVGLSSGQVTRIHTLI